MDSETWDAIVVGSGPGGLTTAACLGSAGKRVLVLERHDVAGGNTQVFRRHHRNADGHHDWFEFDVGVHYIGECQPGGLFPTIFDALGVGDRLQFRPLDADGFDTLHFADFTFRVPAGWDEYEQRLIEQFPMEKAGIERCMHTLRTVAEESRNIFGGERPTFDVWARRPLSELFAESELSEKARATIDHWSGLYAGRPAADRRGDARGDHPPLHERRVLPRGWRADDRRPADPGERQRSTRAGGRQQRRLPAHDRPTGRPRAARARHRRLGIRRR
ncbi:MAG: NAD(P)-binding protein [Actinomycetota bacterium]